MKPIDMTYYYKIKEFVSVVMDQYLGAKDLPAEERPMKSIASLEEIGSWRKAESNLQTYARDFVEASRRFSKDEVEQLDRVLSNRGAFTISQMRLVFLK